MALLGVHGRGHSRARRAARPPARSCLATCPIGAAVRLTAVEVAGRQRLRLAEFGLREGAEVRVLSAAVGGGRIVGIGGSRIALDRATAAALQVAAPGAA